MKNPIPSVAAPAIVIMLVIVVTQSCVDHSLPPRDEVICSTQVSFDADIEPIINSKCAIVGDGGCHNGGNGPDLDWRVFNNFQSHSVEVRRRVQLSPTEADHMPRIGELTENQIALLVCWVNQGALDN